MNTACFKCAKKLVRSPSKVEKRNFCSRDCYSNIRNQELLIKGVATRLKAGDKRNPEWTKKQTEKVSNERNYAWKGENVSYRGLHQWIRRKKGIPKTCTQCGRSSNKPKIIQWANIDGKYRRNLDDFIELCSSCHKLHDRKLTQSTQDEMFASQ